MAGILGLVSKGSKGEGGVTLWTYERVKGGGGVTLCRPFCRGVKGGYLCEFFYKVSKGEGGLPLKDPFSANNPR